MGSGKSMLAERFAQHVSCAWLDLDTQIEIGEQQSIREIFAQAGEPAFRKLEAKYLRETLHNPAEIIATGGGTPCFNGNMGWMNENGITLYLEVSAEVLFQRLRKGQALRPLIQGKSDEELKDFICQRLAERLPFYDTAHFSMNGEAPVEESSSLLGQYFKRFR